MTRRISPCSGLLLLLSIVRVRSGSVDAARRSPLHLVRPHNLPSDTERESFGDCSPSASSCGPSSSSRRAKLQSQRELDSDSFPRTSLTSKGYDHAFGTDPICWRLPGYQRSGRSPITISPLLPNFIPWSMAGDVDPVMGSLNERHTTAVLDSCSLQSPVQQLTLHGPTYDDKKSETKGRPTPNEFHTGVNYTYTLQLTWDPTMLLHMDQQVIPEAESSARAADTEEEVKVFAVKLRLCRVEIGLCTPFVQEQQHQHDLELFGEESANDTLAVYFVDSPWILVSVAMVTAGSTSGSNRTQEAPTLTAAPLQPMVVSIPVSTTVQVAGDYSVIGMVQFFTTTEQNSSSNVVYRWDAAATLKEPMRVIHVRDPPRIQLVSPEVKFFSYVVIGIAGSILLFLIFQTVWYRKEKALQLSQGNFLVVFLLCALTATCSVVLRVPKNDFYCQAGYPLILIPVQCMFAITTGRLWRTNAVISPLLVQQLRNSQGSSKSDSVSGFWRQSVVSTVQWVMNRTSTVQVFPRRESKTENVRRVVSNGQLAAVCSWLTLPQVILQVCSLTLQPQRVAIDWDFHHEVGRPICTSGLPTSTTLMVYCFLALALLIVLQLIMAHSSRSLPSLFNETRVIYETTLISMILILMGMAVIILTDHPTTSPDLEYLVWLIVTLSVTMNSSLRVMLPKLKMVWEGQTVIVSKLVSDHHRKCREQKELRLTKRAKHSVRDSKAPFAHVTGLGFDPSGHSFSIYGESSMSSNASRQKFDFNQSLSVYGENSVGSQQFCGLVTPADLHGSATVSMDEVSSSHTTDDPYFDRLEKGFNTSQLAGRRRSSSKMSGVLERVSEHTSFDEQDEETTASTAKVDSNEFRTFGAAAVAAYKKYSEGTITVSKDDSSELPSPRCAKSENDGEAAAPFFLATSDRAAAATRGDAPRDVPPSVEDRRNSVDPIVQPPKHNKKDVFSRTSLRNCPTSPSRRHLSQSFSSVALTAGNDVKPTSPPRRPLSSSYVAPPGGSRRRSSISVSLGETPARRLVLKMVAMEKHLAQMNRKIMVGLPVSQQNWDELIVMAHVLHDTFEQDVQFEWKPKKDINVPSLNHTVPSLNQTVPAPSGAGLDTVEPETDEAACQPPPLSRAVSLCTGTYRALAKQFRRHVDVRDRRHFLTLYRQVFIGRDAVDSMLYHGMAESRQHATELCLALQRELNLFQNVRDEYAGFKDSEKHYYRFVNKEDSDADSLSCDEDDDSGDEEGSLHSLDLTGENELSSHAEAFMKHVVELDRVTDSRGAVHRKVFRGAEAVDRLVYHGVVKNRWEAVQFGRTLARDPPVGLSLFHHVANDYEFRDDDDYLYQFRDDAESFRASSFHHSHCDGAMTSHVERNNNNDNLSSSDAGQSSRHQPQPPPQLAQSELAAKAEQFRATVLVSDRRDRGKSHRRCFAGSEAVDCLIHSGLAEERSDAIKLGQTLATQLRLFRPVAGGPLGFQDEYVLYRFRDDEMFSTNSLHRVSCYSGTSSTTCQYPSFLLEQAREFRNHVVVKNRITHRMKTFRRCFIGEEAVDKLVYAGIAPTRWDAVLIGRMLARDLNLFQAVGSETSNTLFQDDFVLYRYIDEDDVTNSQCAAGDSMLFGTNASFDTDPPAIGRTSLSRNSSTRRSSFVSPKGSSNHRLKSLGYQASVFRSIVDVRDRVHRRRKHRNVFVGQEAVDCVLYTGLAKSREEAVMMGRKLAAELRLFQPIQGNRAVFCDEEVFYRFRQDEVSDGGDDTESVNRETENCDVDTATYQELLNKAAQFKQHARLKDRRYRMNTYKCFVGVDTVENLVRAKVVGTRWEAVQLGRTLARHLGLFKCVTAAAEHPLFQDERRYYEFCDKPRPTLERGYSSFMRLSNLSLLGKCPSENAGTSLTTLNSERVEATSSKDSEDPEESTGAPEPRSNVERLHPRNAVMAGPRSLSSVVQTKGNAGDVGQIEPCLEADHEATSSSVHSSGNSSNTSKEDGDPEEGAARQQPLSALDEIDVVQTADICYGTTDGPKGLPPLVEMEGSSEEVEHSSGHELENAIPSSYARGSSAHSSDDAETTGQKQTPPFVGREDSGGSTDTVELDVADRGRVQAMEEANRGRWRSSEGDDGLQQLARHREPSQLIEVEGSVGKADDIDLDLAQSSDDSRTDHPHAAERVDGGDSVVQDVATNAGSIETEVGITVARVMTIFSRQDTARHHEPPSEVEIEDRDGDYEVAFSQDNTTGRGARIGDGGAHHQ